MARTLPEVGTNLKPYDGMRRYRATVTGYAKELTTGETMVELRHMTGRRTVASLKHLSETFYAWS